MHIGIIDYFGRLSINSFHRETFVINHILGSRMKILLDEWTDIHLLNVE